MLNKNIKSNKKIYDIVLLVTALLTHALVFVFVFMCKGYYAMSKKIMISLLGIVIVLLLLIDFLLIMTFNHKDKLARIIASVLVILMMAGSITGIVIIGKLNAEVNKVIDNDGVEQYETVYVSFVSYGKEFSGIAECDGKTIGYIYSNEEGTGSIGINYLEENNISGEYITYSSQDDLFFALIGGDVDVAILPSAYQQKYANDSNIDYSDKLNNCYTIYSFEKKIKVGENQSTNKDLTLEPFNVLLIGYAPENDSYGLSDTIILATINPQTLTVGLTSIARDSYVPIACYGNQAKDKINAARGVSRQCLMDTVSDLLDTEIDFYVEVNFKGLVDIVDAVGGVLIYSETSFVGQTSDTERGHYTVEIPEGWYWANGEEALAFARERHAFADGDFARQRHQKQVILSIVDQVMEIRSIDMVMDVMEAAGSNLSTNLSLNQITSLFSYLMNIDMEVEGLSLMDFVEIRDMRITGYSSWHYNEKVHLPLWIYKLYEGSIEETKNSIDTILSGDSDSDQWEKFDYYLLYPYYFPTYYSLVFDEAEVHETMPAYYPNLTAMTYEEVVAWAKEVGVTIQIKEVSTDGYSESDWGSIIGQSVPYGQLVSDYPNVTITVIGGVGEKVPNFVDEYFEVATKWASENEYNITFETITADSSDYKMEKAGKVASQTPEANSVMNDSGSLFIKYYDYFTINANNTFVNSSDANTLETAKTWINKYMKYPESVVYKTIATDDSSLYGSNKIKSASFVNNGTASNTALNNAKTLVLTYYVKSESFTVNVEANNTSYGSVEGGGLLSNASTYVIKATPNAGYKFIGWYENSNLVSSEKEYTISVTKATTYTAVFEVKKTINIKAESSNTTAGSASYSPSTIYEGDQVTLTATANSGYVFVKWSDGSTANPRVETAQTDTTYTAEFAKTYTITVTNGTGSGIYVEGTSLVITATVPEGNRFTGWSDGDLNEQRTITVTADASYQALYEPE